MKWFVLDSETNILNRGEGAVGEQQGHPAHEANKIVSLGEQFSENKKLQYVELYDPEGVTEMPRFLQLALQKVQVLVVVHNAPFDFSYFVKTWPKQMMEALPYIFLWDTMQVEYLLEGQSKVMPSLDWCAEQRGLPLKDDKIKEYWRNGVDTSMIPKEELLEYMAQDVDNTRMIFLDQWNAVSQSPKLLDLVRIKMDDKLLTTFMQIYGMHFNLVTAMRLMEQVDKELIPLREEVIREASQYFVEDFEFNPDSPDQVSALVYGGEYKVVRDEPVVDEHGEPVRFKSGAKKGQIKTKKQTILLTTSGLKMPTKGVPVAKGGWSTGDEHLSKLDHPLVKKLLQLRGLKKDKGTYYEGYSALTWPDGCIRPNINHEVAQTGRQSSSQPNLQNVSKEDE